MINRKNKIQLTLFNLFITFNILAQLPCGTDDALYAHRFDQEILEREWLELTGGTRTMNRKFMVALHIIRNSNGGGGLSKTVILKALDEMNISFNSIGIEFEYCDQFYYVDNDVYFETTPSEGNTLTAQNNIPNAINIYFIPKVYSAAGLALCGNATFPSAQIDRRRIFVANNCVDNGSTLIHEMGHYFGLQHTHATSNGIEYVDRFNCHLWGDGFCDTPADPELSSSNVTNCNYTGGEVDPTGDKYFPDPKNFMSYSPKACRTKFSPQQYAYMSLIANTENSYHNNSCDIYDLILTNPASNLLTLKDFASIDIAIAVESIQLNSLNDVDYQIVAVNSFTLEEIIVQEGILSFENGSRKIQKNLSLDIKEEILNSNILKIKIDPDNEVTEIKENNNLLVYSLLHEYRQNNSAIFYPNPVIDELKIYLNSLKSGALKVKILDSEGKLKMETTINKEFVNMLAAIDVSFLNRGIYFIKIEIDEEENEIFKFIKN